ncbi:MAG: hypothetical protein K2M25_01515 [Muribaculaceae bacterium]|nr:hypothetical protein [Muribaculaceae bacterium]
MTKHNNKGFIKRLSNFISSYRGQIFFNFAYSIGAAIVIWGVLFKLLHLPGGNTLLAIGLGTEIVMFIITAFDFPVEVRSYDNSPTDKPTETHQPHQMASVDPPLADRADKETREYCEQTEALTENMKRLNEIYSNMLSALENSTSTKIK